MNKASGGDGIPPELFQILKDDAVKVLHSICQQIWKTQQWPQDWKRHLLITGQWGSYLGFPGSSVVKNLPVKQETQEARFRSLGWEHSLEKGMATHSSTLAWKIPWTEEPVRLQFMGSLRVRHD